ncbi:hypothetical protein [Actinoplanes sp. NPDC048796]|uniref:hypothetical protein n=1 Tax=unclassified Actinoplanes TaxID=2626549 RepID=UPI0033E417B0
MGSDWTWELHLSAATESSLREFFALAAERNLHPQRPDGLINLFSDRDGDPPTAGDPAVMLRALTTGDEDGQLWTCDETDVHLSWRNETLTWSLDSVFCYRLPSPEADGFRDLHGRLTSLWLDVAQRFNARSGRVLDEWSSDQIWHLGLHDAVHPAGHWPAELGWWTYLAPSSARPAPPLPDVADRTRLLPNRAHLINLLDDPAAVDCGRYQDVHERWTAALP